ncbi:MAG TPA: tRNA (adenosine(37)-N6)-threonylcarbamoyltransferase complex dimerization subunit type 1 TsaB [Hyphomicrobiaceae bacterium]|jgi:tRNA threonylcarbamoyladenosine biosynthesis protein TsaB|nr:tRNA (adenosine(37)-N6)-threonylcarbamoyltransferase complex dimerization subunit type 1 TsaB [Hyphomicrobiaceae bacterium]
MNVIAFDTCLGACSVAVQWLQPIGPVPPDGHHPTIVARYEVRAAGHAESLMPIVREVLREAGASFEDLEAIAVTEGPGSFTGVRLGVATARSLALATRLPIRATTSLHVMACQAQDELGGDRVGHAIAVCVDARNKQVFVQLFGEGAEPSLTPAQLLSPEAVAALNPGVPLVCVGSAAEMVAEAARRSGRQAKARLPQLQPNARYLASLAPSLEIRKPLRPLYLRAPDAKPHFDMSSANLR